MPTIKLIIEYDGTRYAGWQLQDNACTIQGVMETVLARIYKKPVRLTASGRTDSGVHALHQAAHYIVDDVTVPIERLPAALNYHLPIDIRVTDAAIVPDSFHARFSARQRKYVYVMRNARYNSAFYRNFTWFYPTREPLDIKRLNAYAEYVVGTHNFRAFCAITDMNRSKIRTVTRSSFTRRGEFVYFFISADAFLHNMVRITLGTILDLYRRNASPDAMLELIISENRKNAGTTAPAHGLFLKDVIY
ncbi:MAG: tRNA pseudouridine(38-40) synthase TruA [Spirochaetes bacterium]|nr:tRNA pseudouridine(38-40) synthase TruA [Spirochaetota bacterium]